MKSENGRSQCNGIKSRFRICSQWIAATMGSPWAFTVAFLTIVAWGVTGPLFHYSDTWQLVINTATTIVTFLMVFLIQNTQNRDTKAIHLKLDELLRAVSGARTTMVNLENLSDEELDRLQKQFERLRGRLERAKKNGVAPLPKEEQADEKPAVNGATVPARSESTRKVR